MKRALPTAGIATAVGLSIALLLGGASGAQAVGTPDPADPTNPTSLFEQVTDPNVLMQLQTTARLDGEDTVFRIKGTVMTNVAGNAYAPEIPHGKTLFGFDGYNIRQWYRAPGTQDIYMLSREIVFYTDLKTGQVLQSWTNPLDGRAHPIVQVANDHVNQGHMRLIDGKLFSVFGDQTFPYSYRAGLKQFGREIWQANIPPLYSLKDRYGIDDDFGLVDGTYAAWELFNTSVDTAAIKPWTDEILHSSMPTMIDWSRVGPTVPWMCIAESTTNIHLLYNAQSWSLNSFNDLEPWIKELVSTSYPLYKTAPNEVDPTPNATTWTAFYHDQLEGKGPNGSNLKWADWCGNTPAAAATTTTLSAVPATQIFGADEGNRSVLTATVAAVGGAADAAVPTGNVTFTADGNTLGTAPLEKGKATYRLAGDLPAGSYQVVATYGGDDKSAGSASAAVAVQVTTATSVTSLALSKNVYRKWSGKPISATATVQLNTNATAGGEVSFWLDGKQVGQAPVQDGEAMVKLPTKMAFGAHIVSAAYSGTSDISGSRSYTLILLVIP